jgi:hypothetical protein
MTRLSHTDMARELAKLVWSKQKWLLQFSTGKDKRPDHELERVRQERDVLQQATDDYENASKRRAA